jgi:hypothetical protein
MATAPITDNPTPNTTTPQIANLSNSGSSNMTPSPAIEEASRRHRTLFIGYVIWLIIAGLGTAAFTVGVWIANNRQLDAVIADANERTETVRGETEKLKTSNLTLQKEVIEANLKLEYVRKKQERRTIDGQKFMEALKGKPICDIEVVYQPDDDGAAALAKLISLYLSVAGFRVSDAWGFRPIPPDMGVRKVYLDSDGKPLPLADQEDLREHARGLPPTVRAGAIGALNASNKPGYAPTGIFLAINKRLGGRGAEPPPVIDPNTAFGAVAYAFAAVGLPPSQGYDPDLPDNKIRIIVGSKP